MITCKSLIYFSTYHVRKVEVNGGMGPYFRKRLKRLGRRLFDLFGHGDREHSLLQETGLSAQNSSKLNCVAGKTYHLRGLRLEDNPGAVGSTENIFKKL